MPEGRLIDVKKTTVKGKRSYYGLVIPMRPLDFPMRFSVSEKQAKAFGKIPKNRGVVKYKRVGKSEKAEILDILQ